jgi:hypothetical protein
MKLAALAVVSLLPVAAFAPASRPEVGFAYAAPKAGTKHVVTLSHDSNMTLVVLQGGQEVKRVALPNRRAIFCNVAVEAADAASASAGKLVFGECRETNPILFEAPKTERSPWSGKSYMAKRGDAGFVVTGVVELTEAEKAATDLLVAHLLGVAPLAPLLTVKKLKKGDKVEVPANVAEKCFGFLAGSSRVSALMLVMAEEPDAAADEIVFQAAASLSSRSLKEEAPPERTVELAGTWTVSKSTCRIIAMAMKGPIKLRSTIGDGGLNGDGDWTLAWTVATK